ncbi:recombination regulator RecX [Chitinilyticum piscinae]|uniref:Regulatory protein RecX n=1 Tax=Chitinilyticum piscinae TaxID=2866724 RepID=A0A8J7G3M7_9NEIS|nr:recombination regulator RecX [Chitinilyticum piscinae]MBE9610808.1 recombination regulator RecX [Chitinilyticum piscinae]
MTDLLQTLRNKALALLARREYSRAELRQKLLRAAGEDGAELVEQVLDDFKDRNWLSDERFAEQWASQRSARYGQNRLRQELRMKGVTGEVLENALAEHAQDETAAARRLWQKKFGAPPADARERARQLRFLLGRGFSSDVAYRVIGGSGDWDEDAIPD